MRPVSTAYKQAVYNKGDYAMYARHFVPYAILRVVDTDASGAAAYTVNNSSFYSRTSELDDEVEKGTVAWGTLEDGMFLLSGNRVLMSTQEDVADKDVQYGWVTEWMSGSDGTFAASTQPMLTCVYTGLISTAGRTLIFDENYDSYPASIKLEYYRNGTCVDTETITNTKYIAVSTKTVSRYNEVHITFLSTNLPYRRVHLLEEIPGVVFEYSGSDIISMSMNQQVDIFSEEVVDGEIDVSVQNVTKQIDILNADGIEGYLQRRQPMTVKLNLIFPDDTVEEVLLGKWDLTSWKTDKGALEATFTVSDPVNRLTGSKYICGTIPSSMRSLYDYAVSVFADAGFSNYTIDSTLQNIYSIACLPIAEHKELLRMIAQAGQAVVVPTADGYIHIKNMSPLIYAANVLTNGAFNDSSGTITDWTLTNATASQDYLYAGTNSILLGSNAAVQQSITATSGHIYYGSVYVYCVDDLSVLTGSAGYCANDIRKSVDIRTAYLTVGAWNRVSCRFTTYSSATTIAFKSTLPAGLVYIDAMMLLDLTQIYGSGNEPSKEWCDQNIPFFDADKAIPRCIEPTPVDSLDYSILISAPEVELSDPVKSIETKIYNYTTAAESSEVYKGTRVVAGTETFTIQYNTLANDVSLTINQLDSSGSVVSDVTATALVSSNIYNRAAELTVRAAFTIQIIATGKRVTTDTTTYKVNSELAHNLLDEAVEKTIDNELITYKSVAEDVTAYAAYWYGRRYKFDFDWRQNPALELLDTVTVHDDFNNDKGVMLTERDIEFTSGVLSGNAKGVTG